jgi:hypothetical protein
MAMRKAATTMLLAAALGVAGCETYDDYGYRDDDRYGGYEYRGDDYERLGNDCPAFGGAGGDRLDPWLACTDEGRDLVRTLYDRDRDERLDADTADEANVWFRRYADQDRDLCLTDPEIRAALVTHARHRGLARR